MRSRGKNEAVSAEQENKMFIQMLCEMKNFDLICVQVRWERGKEWEKAKKFKFLRDPFASVDFSEMKNIRHD